MNPVPSPALIRALVPVNRVPCLGGIPGLRSIPGLARIPGITGLSNVVAIDFPPLDEARLRDSVAPGFATFITPNHPEFFIDWMLDKEILTRIAPRAASWATHTVVNGMGRIAQAFWLKNNLIAQIPGGGGRAGRAHSVDWALAGHGVLLNPEGQVGWHGHTVGPLFPGAVEMASEATAKARAAGRATVGRVAPVVWKLKFLRDAATALEAEIGYVERRLGLHRGTCASLPERVAAAWRQLLIRHAARRGIHAEATGFSRLHAQLEAETLERLGREPAGEAARLVTERRTRMQSSIDAINATIEAQCAVLRDPNPFS